MYMVHAPNRDRLGLIEKYSSMQWIRRWHTAGAFDLRIPYEKSTWALLERENLIVSGSDAGVIEARWLSYDEKDGAVIRCSGRFLSGYADRRIIWGVVSAQDTPENIMRRLVTDNMTVGDRAFTGLSVASSQGYGTAIDYQDENKNLLEVLESLSESSGLGFDIAFSTSGLTFRVLQGVDRTSSQSTNPRAIFSRAFENVLAQEYTDDAQKYRNVAKVDLEIKDAPTITEVVGTTTGADRREVFVKASGLTKDENGTTLSELQQRALMSEKGAESLADKPVEEAVTVEVDPFGNLVYKQDFDLGDIVTVVDSEWGISQDWRIVQAKEVRENKGYKLELTMGYIAPIKKIVRWLTNG